LCPQIPRIDVGKINDQQKHNSQQGRQGTKQQLRSKIHEEQIEQAVVEGQCLRTEYTFMLGQKSKAHYSAKDHSDGCEYDQNSLHNDSSGATVLLKY